MVWNKEAPQESGRYQWRASVGGRIHNVQVRVNGTIVEMKCKTMDVRQIIAGGEWEVREMKQAEGELELLPA